MPNSMPRNVGVMESSGKGHTGQTGANVETGYRLLEMSIVSRMDR